jgi:hypothetical protein
MCFVASGGVVETVRPGLTGGGLNPQIIKARRVDRDAAIDTRATMKWCSPKSYVDTLRPIEAVGNAWEIFRPRDKCT